MKAISASITKAQFIADTTEQLKDDGVDCTAAEMEADWEEFVVELADFAQHWGMALTELPSTTT